MLSFNDKDWECWDKHAHPTHNLWNPLCPAWLSISYNLSYTSRYLFLEVSYNFNWHLMSNQIYSVMFLTISSLYFHTYIAFSSYVNWVALKDWLGQFCIHCSCSWHWCMHSSRLCNNNITNSWINCRKLPTTLWHLNWEPQ